MVKVSYRKAAVSTSTNVLNYVMLENDGKSTYRLFRVKTREVVDNEALLAALNEGRVRDAVIDVWEHEPHLSLELLKHVYIGTPHIAGYSADGKVNADNMVIDALCRHFGLQHPGLIKPPSLPVDFFYTGDPLQLYNPLEDSQKLKQHPENFESLRNNYPLRREKQED